MKILTDRHGNQYQIEANVAAFKRVRDMTGQNLFEIDQIEESVFWTMLTDPFQICDILWAFIHPEADKKGITQEAFTEGMDAETLTQGRRILTEVLPDFFLDPNLRVSLREMYRRFLNVMSKMTENVPAVVEAKMAEAEREILLSSASTESQEHSESTPADSPSGS